MATESKTLIFLALIANSIIATIKFAAAGVSGSSAMLAEAFHSVADVGNQLFLLRGTAASRFAPTGRHPFGRGKELYFWSFMVAVFLFVGGAVVAFLEGVERIRHPHATQTGFVLSLVVLGLAAAFEGFIALRPALRQFNRVRAGRSIRQTVSDTKDSALLVVVLEDVAALLGLAIAAIGITLSHYTHWPQWDGVASICIAILLAAVAGLLAFEMKSLLVGESASRENRSAIRAATLSVREVDSIGRLLTMQLAPDEILVNMDVHIDDGLTTDQAEAVIDKVEAAIQAVVPEATRIFVELEPAT